MTTGSLGFTLTRLMALGLGMTMLTEGVSQLLLFPSRPDTTAVDAFYMFLAYAMVSLSIFFSLWFSAAPLARAMAVEKAEDTCGEMRANDLQCLALQVSGLILLTLSIPAVLAIVARYIIIRAQYGIVEEELGFLHAAPALASEQLFRVLAGWVLLFKCNRVVLWIRSYR